MRPHDALDIERLAAARLLASDSHPFLAEALYALIPVAKPGLGTFAVDEHWRLFVDPRRLAKWAVPEVAGVLLHEVSHVLRDHGPRARSQGVSADDEHLRWNYAADAEINDDLLRDRVRLPGTPVTPRRLGMPAHRSAEFYYERLRDAPPPGPPLDCGSGAGAAPVAHHESDPPGLRPAEVLLVVRRTAERVREAQRAGRVVAAGWVRWAEATLEPQVDWRRRLHAAVRGALADLAGNVDYSYRRPSRRQVPGVVLPALRRPLPAVAIVVDTSGSMDDGRLAAAWSEVVRCARHMQIRRDRLHLIAADVHATMLTGAPGRRVTMPGGGGTDLRVGIDLALAARPRADIVVVITDGLTAWPAAPSRARTIAVLLPHEEFPAPPPPAWIRTIEIRPEDHLGPAAR